jgi:NADH-ubiquinone oxidoreductase chain 5
MIVYILELIFTLANTAVPMTSGFIAEFYVLGGVANSNPFLTFIISTAIILTPAYALLLFHRIAYGKLSQHLSSLADLTQKEFHMLFPLFTLSLILGIFTNQLFSLLHYSTLNLLYIYIGLINSSHLAFIASTTLLACLQGSPRRSVMLIALAVVITTLASCEIVFIGSAVTLKFSVTGHLWYWFRSLGFSVEWCLLFDGLTVSMLIAIMYVSLLVQLYSSSYMSSDPHLTRFYGYLSLFTFAMTLLVTADNLIVLFMGWEFVGIASYLLINFWFTRINANIAALKAFLLNRVGDWALALGLLLILSLIYDFSTAAIFSLASYINEDLLLLISLFLIIGASAKSALVLLGLHLWLPNAMEGPTPVSALIHAATMVTAGIYLFLRLGPLFECCETALLLITWLGGLGSILGAIAGLLSNDMKKVIAYSTISQLGYMTVSCGSSQYSIALFHLINHAFFKALLFLSAGAIIHAFKDEQDMRKMGSFGLLLPWTSSFVLLGIESMMALPFITGFYSKDFLLELALVPKNTTISVAYILSMNSF